MQYGYFDDEAKEYVITNPETPKSWSNYLGSTDYGAIITNNAGGYSFYKSAARGRFMRMRFNSIPMDQPGRYFYIHDRAKKDFWSTSWQPVGKPLDEFKSICRHGTAYTVIESEYDKVKSESKYFVPLGKEYECWHLKLTNNDSIKRQLRVFTFVEYANNWHLWDDFVNLQYTLSILGMDVKNNIIDHGINVSLPDDSGTIEDHDGNRHTFLASIGSEVTGFDTDRDIFIGTNRAYHNPKIVELGECTNSIAKGDNGCGVLQFDIELEAGTTKELVVFMGIGKADVEGEAVVKGNNTIEKVNSEFEKVKKYWHNKLEGFSVNTPDKEFNSMTNVWSAYNCLITYSWSRAASLVYCGERDGLGYRDTVQDLLSTFHIIPDEAKERLELMITGQLSIGGALPVVKQFNHNPGSEKLPDEKDLRADDCMWLFNTIPAYVKETGDIKFFEKILPYADKGDDSVYNHLKRAIEFNLSRTGAHGLPCGLYADWNDCLELGHEGETVFVAFQLRYALKIFIEISELLEKPQELNWAKNQLNELDTNIENNAWDGEWYKRAFRYDGLEFGTSKDEEGQIWLNPQSWSIISGHANDERGSSAINSVRNRLASKFGALILDPPYKKIDHKVVKAPLFNPGMKENASIFNHTQGWVVMAETILGNGNNAYKYYRSFMPAAYNTIAEVREIEPYVNCQFTHSKYSPRKGAGRLPWLTGAASWSYHAATNYILGIRPEYDGLTIDPCIPSDWEEINVVRKFRSREFYITIVNENNAQKNVKNLILNGEELSGNFIPVSKMKEINKVTAFMA